MKVGFPDSCRPVWGKYSTGRIIDMILQWEQNYENKKNPIWVHIFEYSDKYCVLLAPTPHLVL